MSEKIKLVLSEQHSGVVKKACEAYCRGKLGQFRYMLEEIFPELDYKRGRAIEEFIRAQFREQAIEEDKPAGFYFPNYSNQHWSIGNEKTGDGTLAYEVEKVIENYLAVKRNDGYWKSGADFNEPLCFKGGKLSLDESSLPEIEDFVKYKDFPLSAAKSRKVHTYCVNNQWDKAWEIIVKLMQKGIINCGSGSGNMVIKWEVNPLDNTPNDETYFVRVDKPRRGQDEEVLNSLT